MVPAEPPPSAPSEEATSRGENRVFTELVSERRAWYRRRPRAHVGSPRRGGGRGGGGGGGFFGAAGLFLGEVVVLPCTRRTGKEMRRYTGSLGSMADLVETQEGQSV